MAIIEGKALDIVDCFHVAVWQVLVLNWVDKLELVVEQQLELLPFDFHNSATFHVHDEAFAQDYVLEESDDSLGLFDWIDVDLHSMNDALPADFASSNEIVAIELVVELHVMILERVVGPLGSSKGVEAGGVVAVVAVDDFEVFVSSEIVVFVEFQLEASQLDLDSVNVRSLFGLIPYDYSLGAEPMLNVNSDVEPHSLHKVEVQGLVVVVWGTFDVHFAGNVEIFSVGLVADVVTEELSRILVAVSYHSSCFVVMNRQLAFVSDLVGIQSCVDDN